MGLPQLSVATQVGWCLGLNVTALTRIALCELLAKQACVVEVFETDLKFAFGDCLEINEFDSLVVQPRPHFRKKKSSSNVSGGRATNTVAVSKPLVIKPAPLFLSLA
jgi:hypothetical protein